MELEIAISEVPCHRVSVRDMGEYLRCAPACIVGESIWYVATRNGWELIPDTLYDRLEAAFKQERETKGTLQ